jgi:hypothetical protein
MNYDYPNAVKVDFQLNIESIPEEDLATFEEKLVDEDLAPLIAALNAQTALDCHRSQSAPAWFWNSSQR